MDCRVNFGFIAILMAASVAYAARPNIIFILTDDQDDILGGMIPMEKTRQHFAQNGISFENSFTHIPICCPSRSSILTGQYQHNHGVVNNSLNGNCYGERWRNVSEKNTFVKQLYDLNYTTFFAGKYLNQYGFAGDNAVKFQVPPGWTVWNGLLGNSVYYNYTMSVNGVEEKHGDAAEDYLTDIIHNRSIEFLKSNWTKSGAPFFMMLSTPACHDPFTASDKYLGRFANVTAPRTPNFEMNGGPDKHWLLRQTPTTLSNDTIERIDAVYSARWATLLSVDDMLADVVNVLQEEGLYDNTYVFFASDNGYHYGQFSLPKDKRQMYEFDIRVPLMVSGPGITPGLVRKEAVVNVDLAPTFLELAEAEFNGSSMDGISLLPLLQSPTENGTSSWRSSFLVEYTGEGSANLIKECPQYGDHPGVSECKPACICEDAWNNTFTCLRWLEVDVRNTIYCVFDDSEDDGRCDHLDKEFEFIFTKQNLRNLETILTLAICGILRFTN